MNLLTFSQSAFWIWLGCLISVVAVGNTVKKIVKAARGTRELFAFHHDDGRWSFHIMDPRTGDISEILEHYHEEKGNDNIIDKH